MGGFTPFVGITLAQMRAALTARLQDPNYTFWSISELNANIVESLRTFNAYTGYWRTRIAITIPALSHFIDLMGSAPGFNITVKDTQIVSAIQEGLMEPDSGIAWTGTDQFTYAQVVQALQDSQNQFLQDTGIIVKTSILPFPSPPLTRLILPQGTIDVRRVAWKSYGPPSKYYPLTREDERTVSGYKYGWQLSPQEYPTVFSQSTTPPISIQLAPPPQNVGFIEIVTVNTGTLLSPSDGVLLSIPDDFSWAIKWGALATLLSTDGQSRDFARATYCSQRYAQAVTIARLSPSVLMVQINGVDLSVDSIAGLDGFSPNWENLTPSTPLTVGMCGRNLIALSPSSGTLVNGTVDTVINIPIPVADSNSLQIPPEYYEAVLNYAHHISAFKMGGQEFTNTNSLYSAFMDVCTTLNSRIAAIAGDRIDLELPATLETAMVPRIRSNA